MIGSPSRAAYAVCGFALALLALGCGSDGAGSRDCTEAGADCTLREAADQAGVLIGTAIRDGFEGDPEYVAALTNDFNSLTAENAMKWAAIQPERGRFDFGLADAMVELAEANGMAVRGHTLLWDQEAVDSTPAYVSAITDPDELRALMADHIRTVVGRYRGRIDSWDVVNEPLQTTGAQLYDNVFHRLLGPGYIAEALALAHEADPDAVLFVNEPLVESAGAKFDALLALTSELRAQGAPVHGVGLQGHFFAAAEPDELRANIEALASLGVVVELTEVDVLLRSVGDDAARLEHQRQEYYDIASACFAVPACRRITLWGFTDRFTWIDSFIGPGFAPLVLDESYARKPAYFGLRDALLGAIR